MTQRSPHSIPAGSGILRMPRGDAIAMRQDDAWVEPIHRLSAECARTLHAIELLTDRTLLPSQVPTALRALTTICAQFPALTEAMRTVERARHAYAAQELPEPEELWTTSEVAAYLRCTPHTVYRHVMHLDLPSLWVGRRRRFRKADVDAWMRRQGEG